MTYQYNKWYYNPQLPGSWSNFVYVYEINHPQHSDYKSGYELAANYKLEYIQTMYFEAVDDLDYLKQERYKEVPANLIGKLNKLKIKANRNFIKELFE